MIIFLSMFYLLPFINCKTIEIKAKQLLRAEFKYKILYTGYQTWYDYAGKVWRLNGLYIFVNNFFKFCILRNLYKIIMHKQGFGHA
jgi:hypothetical protein